MFYVLYKDVTDYIKTKLISSFSTIFIGVGMVIIIAVYGHFTDENRMPVVLYATRSSGVSHCGITLRTNGRYYFFNGSPFGMFRTDEKYSLKDSVISIEKPNSKEDRTSINEVIKSTRLLIRTETPKWKNDTLVCYLYQINDISNLPDSLPLFIVYEDNRIME